MKTERQQLTLALVAAVLLLTAIILANRSYIRLQSENTDLKQRVDALDSHNRRIEQIVEQGRYIDRIQNWKTLRNAENGINFKYPDSWTSFSLDSVVTESGQYLVSNNGSNIPTIGVNSVYSLYAYANDYSDPPFPLNRTPINPNWSKSEFIEKMGIEESSLVIYKKLSDRATLVGLFKPQECSPFFELAVLSPLSTEYPNLEIRLTGLSFLEVNELKAFNQDSCDLLPAYQRIARDIENETYSPTLDYYLTVAKAIAQSIETEE